MRRKSESRTAEKGVLYAPWEEALNRVLTPFEEFLASQTTTSFALMLATALALVLANSPLVTAYEHVIHTVLSIKFGGWELSKTLHHWVNDGLMALFFFLAGLEIKREALVGELADPRRALLPILAAVGGMVAPAVIYFGLNPDGSAARGWGIPMATDIAFAVGALALLGSRIPKSLVTFLVALAIVDDLGAVAIIAIFYTDTVQLDALTLVGGLLLLLIAFNLGGIRRPLPYFLIGALVWFAMLKSGIHATVAGVMVAFTIPARAKYNPQRFGTRVRALLDRFQSVPQNEKGILANQDQYAVVQTLENALHKVETPLQRLEHSLHLPVAFLIIPIFALVNAGVPIAFESLDRLLLHPVALGIILGLVLGKLIGIAGVTWLAVRLRLTVLPPGVTAMHLVGVGLLGGIGFTMSIFVAELGFAAAPGELLVAKTAILMASLLAGLAGCSILLFATQSRRVPIPKVTPRAQRAPCAPQGREQ